MRAKTDLKESTDDGKLNLPNKIHIIYQTFNLKFIDGDVQ